MSSMPFFVVSGPTGRDVWTQDGANDDFDPQVEEVGRAG